MAQTFLLAPESVHGHGHGHPWLSESVCPCLSGSVCPRLSESVYPWLSESVCPCLSGSVCPWLSESVYPWLSESVYPWLSESVCPFLHESVCPSVAGNRCIFGALTPVHNNKSVSNTFPTCKLQLSARPHHDSGVPADHMYNIEYTLIQAQ
jgi:hypothetical protein